MNRHHDKAGHFSKVRNFGRQLEREYPGVQVTVTRHREWREVWNLDAIWMPRLLRGHGTGAACMQKLVDAADQAGAIITLRPSTSIGGSSVARLRIFYARFGFTRIMGHRSGDKSLPPGMIRLPRPSK